MRWRICQRIESRERMSRAAQTGTRKAVARNECALLSNCNGSCGPHPRGLNQTVLIVYR